MQTLRDFADVRELLIGREILGAGHRRTLVSGIDDAAVEGTASPAATEQQRTYAGRGPDRGQNGIDGRIDRRESLEIRLGGQVEALLSPNAFGIDEDQSRRTAGRRAHPAESLCGEDEMQALDPGRAQLRQFIDDIEGLPKRGGLHPLRPEFL
jgi:hypothetical protein